MAENRSTNNSPHIPNSLNQIDQGSGIGSRRPKRRSVPYDQSSVDAALSRRPQKSNIEDSSQSKEASKKQLQNNPLLGRAAQIRYAAKAAKAAGGDFRSVASLGRQIAQSVREITRHITLMHIVLLSVCSIWDGVGFVVEMFTGSLSSWLLFGLDFAFGMFFILFSIMAFQQFSSTKHIIFRTAGGPVTTVLEIMPIVDALPFWILNALVLIIYDVQAKIETQSESQSETRSTKKIPERTANEPQPNIA